MLEHLDPYLVDLAAQGKRPLTLKSYAADIRTLARFMEREGLSLATLGRPEMRAYQRFLASRYEPASVHRKIHGARGYLRWLVEEGVITEDPSKGIVLGRLPDKDPNVVTDEEVEKILREARKDLRALALLSLLAYTGARRAEILGALWGDVDLHQRTWRIRGKGGHNRTVPLISPLVEILHALRAESFPGPEERLLQNRFGQPLGRDQVRKIVNRYAKEAGITRRITPHAFRHGTATRLAAHGVDPFTIASLLGHRDLATTQRYVHPGAGQKRDALEALAIQESAASAAVPSAPKPAPDAVFGLVQLLSRGDWKEMPKSRIEVSSRLWQDLHSLLLLLADYQHETDGRAAEGPDRA